MARYAIGDIQGCMASLERLLSLISYSPSRDQLWLVGDLVNRGPRSLDVLRWAIDRDDITCVLGNHDLHLLARVAGAASEKKRDTLGDVLAAPDLDRLVDWLRARPLLHVDGALAMVHAGLHPQWDIATARELAAEVSQELRGPSWRALLATLATQGTPPRWHPKLGGGDRMRAVVAYLTRARTLHTADGRIEPHFDDHPSKAPAEVTPWFAMPARAWATHTIVFGHWAALGLDIGARHVALDTGCVWGKSLTAYRLDDRSVFQAKAVEAAS